jgi:hypothetical protein
VTSAAHVLTVLLAMPPCWADRDAAPGAKEAQLTDVAHAVADASGGSRHMSGLLLTIGYHESRWCLAVHSGARRGGRGEGLWQLEGRHHGAGARSGLGLEATTSAARLAAAHLQRSYQCGRGVEALLTAYAGRPCVQALEGWPTLGARVSGYWWAVSALRRAGAT